MENERGSFLHTYSYMYQSWAYNIKLLLVYWRPICELVTKFFFHPLIISRIQHSMIINWFDQFSMVSPIKFCMWYLQILLLSTSINLLLDFWGTCCIIKTQHAALLKANMLKLGLSGRSTRFKQFYFKQFPLDRLQTILIVSFCRV